MPVAVETLQHGSLVLEVWAGKVDARELLALASPHLAPRVLVDVVHASFPDVVPQIQRFSEQAADARIAVVASAQSGRAVGFYERLCVRYGVNVIVFSSIVTACSWLDADLVDLERRIARIRDDLLAG